MKQTISILTFILFVFTSCSTDTKTSTDTTTPENSQRDNSANDFEKYLKTLDQIPLPFSHNSFEPLEALSKNYDKKTFEKYKHIRSNQPLGILFNNSKTVTLIDFSIGDFGIVPFLTTYDKQGNKIDSLVPYQKTRHDPGYVAIEYLTINKNKTILVVDSVTTYSLLPRNSDFGDMSGKVTTGVTKYIIEPNGRIRENK
jgi:hypothetical protein